MTIRPDCKTLADNLLALYDQASDILSDLKEPRIPTYLAFARAKRLTAYFRQQGIFTEEEESRINRAVDEITKAFPEELVEGPASEIYRHLDPARRKAFDLERLLADTMFQKVVACECKKQS